LGRKGQGQILGKWAENLHEGCPLTYPPKSLGEMGKKDVKNIMSKAQLKFTGSYKKRVVEN